MRFAKPAGILCMLCLVNVAGRLGVSQSSPSGSGTPSGTPATAATPASTGNGAAASPTAASAAATSCPAAFGIFGTAAAPSSTGAATPAAATMPSVSVQQTNGGSTTSAPPVPANPPGAPPGQKPYPGVKAPAALIPLTGVIPVPDGMSASDIAAAFSGKIVGVSALIPVGRDSLFYAIDPSKFAPPSGGTSASKTPSTGGSVDINAAAKKVEKQLWQLIASIDPPVSTGHLHTPQVHLEVITLSSGFGHACDIITAIGHQAQGVLSLAVIDDTRILAGLSGVDEQVNLQALKKLASQLAVPAVVPDQNPSSAAVRLYYDRDADSVAGVITSAFSEIKASAVSTSATSAFNDVVVLADPTGSAKALAQAGRVIAQLDEPRPQLTVNAWSLQLSSDKQGGIDELVPKSRYLAGAYNDVLQVELYRGWAYLTTGMAAEQIPGAANGIALDSDFVSYLCGSSIYALSGGGAVPNFSVRREGLCATNDLAPYYGLGYTTIFDRLPPDLIRMLLVVAAAHQPLLVSEGILNAMEDPLIPLAANYGECVAVDEKMLGQVNATHSPFMSNLDQRQPPARIGFECTRTRLRELLWLQGQYHPQITSFIGQFRAAIADFLFQNKMRAEYPNDFQAFLYPASAAALDAALTPIVDAFNQDMEVLQQHLQRQLTENVANDKHLSYTSNGLVTVKVVSGNQAQVQTQSLNYFPQNPTMKLEDFAKALVSGGGSSSQSSGSGSTTGGGSGTAAKAVLLGGTLNPIISAVAAYSAAQPAQVTAKVGSGLALTVTPHTLSSATGAELNVNVVYNENAAAMISSDTTKSQANDDLNSRVSEHEVTTLVRMDCLKFFEISTMQSVIARQRDRWKPIDPVVEIPLLSGLGYGVRRKPQVIYNQSVIFMQATIVPTAADLGNSLRIQYDKIGTGACLPETAHGYREAHSPEDFCAEASHGQNALAKIMDYHKSVVEYFLRQSIGPGNVVQIYPVMPFPAAPDQEVSLDASN